MKPGPVEGSSTADYHTDLLEQYLVSTTSVPHYGNVPGARRRSIIKPAVLAFTAAFSAAEPRRIGWSSATGLASLGSIESTFRSASDEQATLLRLRERVAGVLSRAFHEEFREGMPSEFSEELRLLVESYGTAVVAELQRLITLHGIHPDVGFEALTALASFPYSSIAADRFLLIEWALTSSSPEIRYGAALAVVTLREPAAVRPLETAIKRELIPDLRKILEKVLHEITENRVSGASL